MGTKFAIYFCVAVAASLMDASRTRAAAPGLSDYVWNESTLSFKDCMDRASNALRQVGVSDVQQTIPSDGLGFIGGVTGDYYLSVICLSSKGIVITQSVGSDFSSADKLRQQLDAQMKLSSP